jgi:hypothetical protein
MMAIMTFSYLYSGEEDDDYDAILYVFVFERR